jgi:hypothetical protein
MPHRLRNPLLAACAAIVLFALTAELRSQALLYGVILDDSAVVPISSAEVRLLDHRQRVAQRVITDSEGRFRFMVGRAGHYHLEAGRIGYRTATSPRFEVQPDDSIGFELRLDTEAVLLAPLEITARSRRTSPVLDGFLHRRERGFGHYITREDIERRNAFYLSDILTTVPGVRVSSTQRGGRGRNVSMARALPGEGDCPVQVFVDGFHMNPRVLTMVEESAFEPSHATFRTDHGFVLDDVLSPASVVGIEVYRGVSTVPAEFITPDARCGTVVIWTRRGSRDPG